MQEPGNGLGGFSGSAARLHGVGQRVMEFIVFRPERTRHSQRHQFLRARR
jgi:hypothetical protein